MPHLRNPCGKPPPKTKRLRCTVVRSEQTEPEAGFCYGWKLFMPCGKIARSRAEDPPIHIACSGKECNSKISSIQKADDKSFLAKYKLPMPKFDF